MGHQRQPEPCPWWLGYVLVSPLRRLFQHPRRWLEPYVKEGMLVVEPGCGMGFFTLEMARMLGPEGRVVAVDLQPRMLGGLQRRARRAGLSDLIELRRAGPGKLGIEDLAGEVDLIVAIYVVHELPDRDAFFAETRAALNPAGRMLIVEPRVHGGGGDSFAEMLGEASGFSVAGRPRLGSNQSALLEIHR